MSNETMSDKTVEHEKTYERNGKFVARLRDLNLGNGKNGIPSQYAETSKEGLNEIATEFAEKLREPTDLKACGCIDGRHTLCNADGSATEVRLRRVGGSASNFGVALNAEASVIDTLDPDSDLGAQVMTVDAHVKRLTGFDRSAHLGGCGGANGEVDDNEAIHDNPAILAAVKAFMEIEEIREYLGVDYDEALGERVHVNAGKTAQLLKTAGWVGQKYVDGVVETNAAGVEDLEVDHDDKEHHGHKENSIVVIIGDKTIDIDNEFVWNLKASKMAAEAFAGQRGKEGYTQAIIAEIAKHLAVANRLPSVDTPILLIQG
ncbi:MAG: hypothetical protein JWP06_225 [Candidatus Saccharibacteria bacterium]|nr:hypothetical protein [Candidatus Saccharibacteria bacterium]